jgi:hypothetical protein
MCTMAPIPQHQSNEWVFITTTPTRPRPTKGQRSQMRRRVMREIGYTRRNVQTALFQSPSISSCTSSDITASDSGSSPSPVERQYGSSQSAECPTSSTHIPSFLASPVVLDRESQRLLHHSMLIFIDVWSHRVVLTGLSASVLRCHPEPVSDLQRPLVSNMHHEFRRV